jgi:DNA-directed RNA polymerase specialized sigma subunit/DNA-binding CsgD family transcriptional regulator
MPVLEAIEASVGKNIPFIRTGDPFSNSQTHSESIPPLSTFAPDNFVVTENNRRDLRRHNRWQTGGIRLTHEQESILFRNLDRPPSDVLSKFSFARTDAVQEQEKLERIFRSNATIEGVVISVFQGLVFHYVSEYAAIAATNEEKVEGAEEGLVRAIKRFDPDSGARFSSFAAWDIQRGIARADREKLGLKNEHQYKDLRKARQISKIFMNLYKRYPTSDELRQQLLANTEISLEGIETVIEIQRTLIPSLKPHRPQNDKGDDTADDPDMAVDTRAATEIEVVKRIFRQHAERVIFTALGKLSTAERGLVGDFMTAGDARLPSAQLQGVFTRLREEVGIVGLGKEMHLRNAREVKGNQEDTQGEEEYTQTPYNLKGLSEERKRWIIKARARLEQVAALKNSGMSNQDICESLGLKPNSVEVYVTNARRIGLLPPRNNLDLEEVRRMLKEGSTQKDIAERFKHTGETVKRFIGWHIEHGSLEPILSRKDMAENARDVSTELVKEEMDRQASIRRGLRRKDKKEYFGTPAHSENIIYAA